MKKKIRLSCQIPQTINLAFSGGVDSHFGYHFLKKGKRNITLIHFNHGTPMSHLYEYAVRTFARGEGVSLDTHYIGGKTEHQWRNARYAILSQYSNVITCHHKDDNHENLIMRKREIPACRDNYLRPFLHVSKKTIYDYANRHNLIWIEDPTNKIGFTQRNQVRNQLIPLAKEIGVSI